jgi:predicted DNA-binding helix-hairpin-helix protein
MDTVEKLGILGMGAKYDMCGCGRVSEDDYINNGIYRVKTASGTCSIFKVLLSNECTRDCAYCQNRIQRDIPRTTIAPEDMARLFIQLFRQRKVQGLFLSSGIQPNSSASMDNLIKTAQILRQRYNYKGYIHMKILPGASTAHIEAAATVANRLSINLEVPDAEHLKMLSRSKRYADLAGGMEYINKLRQKGIRISQTTQFIVGAADESDRDIVYATWKLKERFSLARTYFSAFTPVIDTPLENKAPTPLIRETRLYQVDFLFRQYGFTPDHLVFDNSGHLLQDVDPKTAFALHNPQLYPIEINKADYQTLLLIPGIGPISAKRIEAMRRAGKITDPMQLKATGAVLKHLLPFVTINGKYYPSLDAASKGGQQLTLWDYNAAGNKRAGIISA